MGDISLSVAVQLLICGAAGALTKDIVVDGKLKLPKILAGELILGSLGGVLIGALVGYFVDHSTLTAFLGGFTGFAALEALMPKQIQTASEPAASEAEPAAPVAPPPPFTIRLPFDGNFPITQKFGENPEWYKANGFVGHFGLDFGLPNGTPVKACDHGVVSRVGFTTGNGFFCELKHNWGFSLVCHLKKIASVAANVEVSRGEQIGLSGNTGAVRPAPTPQNPLAGSHLHFSIKLNGVSNPDFKDYIDPTPFFESI